MAVSPHLLVLERLSHTLEWLVELGWCRHVTCLRRSDGHMSEHVAQEKQFTYFFFFNFTLRPLTLTLRDSGAPRVAISGLP